MSKTVKYVHLRVPKQDLLFTKIEKNCDRIFLFRYEYTLVLNLKRCLLRSSWQGVEGEGRGVLYMGEISQDKTWILIHFSVLKEGARFNARFS